MNKDQVKGAIDDLAGKAKRKVGELTGDRRIELGGAAQQAKGKLRKAWGDAKEAAKHVADGLNSENIPQGESSANYTPADHLQDDAERKRRVAEHDNETRGKIL